MFYIANGRGFFEGDVLMNGRHHPKFTRDIREAMPFETYSDAEKAMRPCADGKYFAILGTSIPFPHV